MKLPPPPPPPSSSSLSLSSPSSSSGSFSFDSKGCFVGILHRILCSWSVPTHPSDHITESCSVLSCDLGEEAKQTSLKEKVAAPSIVARLMGLESMPNKTPEGVQNKPSSITRSRSMNSLDCKRGMDQMQGGHRRVKSSTLSVIEMPAFLELENEEFLVLSFENVSEERKMKSSSSRRKKPDTTSLPLKKSCEKQVCPGFENPECSTPVKNNEESESEIVKFRKRKKKKKKGVENECSSEDSSPVSVLDFDQYMTDHEVPRSELDSNSVESNSRRKLSSEPGDFEFDFQQRIQRHDSNLMISEDTKTKKSEGKCVGSRIKEGSWQSHCYMETWDQICKMTEDEIAGSKWLYRESHDRNILNKHQDYEQICVDFESQIVDQSLEELVQQLVELHMKSSTCKITKPL